MAENKKYGPFGYFNGRPHFSFDNSLIYHPHKFRPNKTIQEMVKRAEDTLNSNQFKE